MWKPLKLTDIRNYMPIKLTVSHGTDRGKIYEINEDSVFSFEGSSKKGDSFGLLIVADGIGGHKAGEVASQLVIDSIREQIEPLLKKNKSRSVLKNKLLQAVKYANKVVYEQGNNNPQEVGDMGSTLTCALVKGKFAIIANVGDSRTYRLRDGYLHQITQDHSLVGEMVRKGLVQPEEVFHHPHRSVITRALGNESEVEIDIVIEKLESGDRLLLCSDGLWEMTRGDDVITEILQSSSELETVVKSLIDKANENGGQDNISVIVADINAI